MTLPPPTFTPVAPPAEGLQLAFAAARRRRTGKATVASGLTAAAMVFGLALAGGPGDQTLLQEPLPPARGGLPTEIELRPAPARTPEPAVQVVPEQQQPAAAAASRSVVRATSPAPSPAASAAPAQQPGRTRRQAVQVSRPMQRSGYVTVPSDPICPVRKRSQNSRGLCTEVSGFGQSDGTTTLQSALCNTDTATARLSYRTALEVDVTVSNADGELWRWSVGQRLAGGEHTLVLGPGDCFIWTTSWARVDGNGRPLPAGTYTLRAEFAAAELPLVDRVASSRYSVPERGTGSREVLPLL